MVSSSYIEILAVIPRGRGSRLTDGVPGWAVINVIRLRCENTTAEELGVCEEIIETLLDSTLASYVFCSQTLFLKKHFKKK